MIDRGRVKCMSEVQELDHKQNASSSEKADRLVGPFSVEISRKNCVF